MDRVELLKKLFTDNGLTKDDAFKKTFNDGKSFTIITRSGIEKIQFRNNYDITYRLSYYPEAATFVCHAVVKHGDKVIETFGEASPKNCTTNYLVAMAEKRAMSRAVLKMAGFYELGVFGEDESDDFKQ